MFWEDHSHDGNESRLFFSGLACALVAARLPFAIDPPGVHACESQNRQGSFGLIRSSVVCVVA